MMRAIRCTCVLFAALGLLMACGSDSSTGSSGSSTDAANATDAADAAGEADADGQGEHRDGRGARILEHEPHPVAEIPEYGHDLPRISPACFACFMESLTLDVFFRRGPGAE